MDEIPVASRTQRRSERRQMVVMGILVVAIAASSFFLGVMVGERSGAAREAELAYQTSAQVVPPPLPAATAAVPSRLTFYDDLPKGNAAPLGSGINLPKDGYASPPVARAPVAEPVPAAPVPAPEPEAAVAAPAAAAKAKPPAPAAKAAAPAPAAPAPKASGGALVVQAAATKDQAEARRMVEKLRGKGFTATAERADLGAKGVWYRVTVGPYADRAKADKVAAQLRQLKFSPMVRNR